jgi:hypothetical protein
MESGGPGRIVPQAGCATAPTAEAILDTLAIRGREPVKLPRLILPVVAAAVLASGCASWGAHDQGNDYQCGYAGSTEGYDNAFAGRRGWSGCGADYAAAAVAHGIITDRTPDPPASPAMGLGRQGNLDAVL